MSEHPTNITTSDAVLPLLVGLNLQLAVTLTVHQFASHLLEALADEINFLFYISFYVRDPLDRRHRVEPLYLRYFQDMFKPIYWTRTEHMEKGVPVVEDKLEINTEVGKYPTTSFVNMIRKHREVQQFLG